VFATNRKLTLLVGEEAYLGGKLEETVVYQSVTGRDVGMLAHPIWTCTLTDIHGSGGYQESSFAQFVGDRDIQCERIARERMQSSAHHNPV
jgi:hypothetical protein